MSDFAREEAMLGDFLADADSRDTLAWITDLLRSFYTTVFSWLPVEKGAMFARQMKSQTVTSEPGLSVLICGVAALMAASEEARLGVNVSRAQDLVDLAFLRFKEFRDALRSSGLDPLPYPSETTEQRRDALRASAVHIRASFSCSDWEAISAARMSSLR